MITAKFGSKEFKVSPETIYTPNGVSISEELDIEEAEVSEKKPTITVKGTKLQGLSFELKLDARFVDVYKEISFWKQTLLAKKSDTFYLGDYLISKFYLTKYEVKDIALLKNGKYSAAKLSLSFTEDGEYANEQVEVEKESEKAYGGLEATKQTNMVKESKKEVKTITVGSTIKPKSGARWYHTADGSIRKSGLSGKAYQREMKVTYVYPKTGKVISVNPLGLGWLKVEDVTLIENPTPINRGGGGGSFGSGGVGGSF